MGKINKKGQIWVETVIYTLIGLVLIGTVLGFATPAIQKQKDKAIIQDTITSMNELDNQIINVRRGGIANTRNFDFSIKKGELRIDTINDRIVFIIDELKYEYSEPGTRIDISGTNMDILTEKQSGKYRVTLALEYRNQANLTYNGEDNEVQTILTPTSVAYSLVVENKGKFAESEHTNIDIYEIQR